MSMNFKRRLPIPQEIREGMPLSAELAAKKVEFDAQVAIIRFFAETPIWVAPLLVMLVALGVAWRRWHAGRADAGRADGSRDDVEAADLTA